MQANIFVTGGTGFLGSYLLRYLVKQGYKNIYALKRKTSPMDLVKSVEHKIKWLEGDILDVPFLETVMKDMDQVYHCAAMVSFDPKDAVRMMQINEIGTENIVNIALHHNIKKLVHISSIAAIGKETEGQLISENTKWKDDLKNSNYSKSKYAAEMQVWRGIAEGLNAAILNPSVILGSGFWNTSSCEIFRIYGNGFPFYTDGSSGFVDVRDVAKMAILLMESNISEERFLVNAENLAYQTVFNQIAQQAQVSLPKIKINATLTAIGWRMDWLRSKITGQKRLITKESVGHTADDSSYNNQKSIKAFDFQYTPIQKTIQETVKQLKEAKKNGMKSKVLELN